MVRRARLRWPMRGALLAALALGAAACGAGAATGPAWPKSAGVTRVGEAEDDGGESLAPHVSQEAAAVEASHPEDATPTEAPAAGAAKPVVLTEQPAPAAGAAAGSDDPPPIILDFEEEIVIDGGP